MHSRLVKGVTPHTHYETTAYSESFAFGWSAH